MANAIHDRSFVLQDMKAVNSTLLPMPTAFLDSLQLKNGLYTIYTDMISYKDITTKPENVKKPYDTFYFAIAEDLKTPYYKQQPYAALTDVASDGSWHWWRNGPFMNFNYYPALPALKKQTDTPEHKILTVQSLLPPRFVYLNTFPSLIPLFVVIGLLIYALNAWLRINLHQIFLIKHIYGKKDPPLSFS
jgi:hypothetical protein